jgi:hypothetical protein
MSYTNGARRVLALALAQATKLDRNFISDTDLLLAMIECEAGVGHRILENHYVDMESLRKDVLLRESQSKSQ